MKKPCNWRDDHPRIMLSLISLCLMCACTLSVNAQFLNLGSNTAPKAGSGALTLELAEQLKNQAEALTDEDEQANHSAIAFRYLASTLLEQGEQMGEQGSTLIVLGRTIAHALPMLDELLLDDPSIPQPSAWLASGALTRLSKNNLNNVDLVARSLRDALAPIAPLVDAPDGTWGWALNQPLDTDQNLADLQQLERISPASRARQVAALQSLIQSGLDHRAYAQPAEIVAHHAAGASRLLSFDDPWLTDAALKRLDSLFDRSLDQLADPQQSPKGIALLRTLNQATVINTMIQSLDTSGGRGGAKDAQEIGSSFSNRIASPTWPSGNDIDQLAMLKRALELINESFSSDEQAFLIRHLKPAWRVLDRQALAARKALVSAIPRLLDQGHTTTDPALLSAIASYQRIINHQRAFITISQHLSINNDSPFAKPGIVTERWKTHAALLLKLAKQIAEQKSDSDQALTTIASFASLLERSSPVTNLASLTDAPGAEHLAPWPAKLLPQAVELSREIQSTRQSWLESWSRDPTSQATGRLGAKLDRLIQFVPVALDAKATLSVIATDRTNPANAWPGWEMNTQDLRRLSDGLEQRLYQTLVRTIENKPNAEKSIRELITSYTPALLAGRIHRLAQKQGYNSRNNPKSSALHELVAGAPDPALSWLAAQRHNLAIVCRYVPETRSLKNLRDQDNPLLNHIFTVAKRAYDALPDVD